MAVTIDTVSSDDMLNAAEKGADLVLSGQTQGVEAAFFSRIQHVIAADGIDGHRHGVQIQLDGVLS